MRILLEFIVGNYKVWHGIAKELKRIYPQAQFAGIVGFPRDCDYVIKFLENQKDIKYKFLINRHKMIRESLNCETDLLFLKKFERGTPYKSIWKIIAADRDLGKEYIPGTVWKETFLNTIKTREDKLKIFTGMAKRYHEIFDQFKPDLCLPAVAMGSIEVFIMDKLCRERRISYLVPTTCRFDNWYCYAEGVDLNFCKVNETYTRLMEGRVDLDLTKAKKLYLKLMSELEDPQYFQRKEDIYSFEIMDTFLKRIKFQFRTLKKIISSIVRWFKESDCRKTGDVRRQPSTWTAFKGNLSFIFHQRYHNYKLLQRRFGTKLPPDQKYIYFPLHINPEHSTQIHATMWMDQLYVIEMLSKSIPSDWVVYVKEHPVTLNVRARPWNFYKRIMSFPNVVMAPMDSDMHRLISNAEMVAVITGTAGWEAIQRGKPVINFGECFWDILELSKRCKDSDSLAQDILNEWERCRSISLEERKRRLTCYLAAVIEHGFQFTSASKFRSNKSLTDIDCERISQELTNGLLKYLQSEDEKMKLSKV